MKLIALTLMYMNQLEGRVFDICVDVKMVFVCVEGLDCELA